MRRRDETNLQRELLAALPTRLPNLRLYRRMVVAEVAGTKVRFGVAGQCDLHGFTRGGRAVEVELKSATGVLSAPQVRGLSDARRQTLAADCHADGRIATDSRSLAQIAPDGSWRSQASDRQDVLVRVAEDPHD